MAESRDLWLAIYRAICMIKSALEKFLGYDKNKCDKEGIIK